MSKLFVVLSLLLNELSFALLVDLFLLKEHTFDKVNGEVLGLVCCNE